MKIKFQHARGNAVFDYKNDCATLEEAVEILKDPNVIKITVTKMTPTQYLRRKDRTDGDITTCDADLETDTVIPSERCEQCVLHWLRQPAEEVEPDIDQK